MNRHSIIQAIVNRPKIPVLIVGGGINGAGLYRELALQGVDAYLVEKGDFLSGASSASSHMIHGGLRYMENSEFRLVRESIAERNRLLKNAPHYVKPLPTTIPIFNWTSGIIPAIQKFLRLDEHSSNRGALLVKIGLMMYDFYTRYQQVLPAHTFNSRSKSLEERPRLNDKIVCTATYYDAWISYPERLGLEVIIDGGEANPKSKAINYMRLISANGNTVQLSDEISGETITVQPQIVINATGAWIDFTNQSLSHKTSLMGGTKGSHLIIDNQDLFDSLNGEMIYFENDDGRVCIMFPYQGKVLAGSTDIRIDNPDEAICTPEEEAYILDSIRNIFPEIKIAKDEIVFRYCGVRPLAGNEKSSTALISRDHSCEIVEANETIHFPTYSLVGGKWTTFRAFSEQVADKVLVHLAQPRKLDTYDIAIGGGRNFPATKQARDEWIHQLEASAKMKPERIALLLERYGTRAVQLIDYIQSCEDKPLQHAPHFSRCEIEFMAQYEYVCHLTDLVLRRTLLAMLGKVTIPLLEELASIIVPILGWSDSEVKQEIESTAQYLRQRHGMQFDNQHLEGKSLNV
ncbi:MAG: glycerol-3-phosphate dehydrogenase/oxidase [Aggregatilineales bacterium]